MVYAKYLMDEYDKREYSMNEILEWNQHVFTEAFSYEEKKRKFRFLKVLAGIPIKERSRNFGLRKLVSLFDNEILIPVERKPSQFYACVTYSKMIRLMMKETGIENVSEIERIMDTLPYPSKEFVKRANALPDSEVEDKVSEYSGFIDTFPIAEKIMEK